MGACAEMQKLGSGLDGEGEGCPVAVIHIIRRSMKNSYVEGRHNFNKQNKKPGQGGGE